MPVVQSFIINFSKREFIKKSPLIDCKVNILTLGCSNNTVDSEQLANQLKVNDFKVVFESEKYLPITIINTCSFIHEAKQQSIDVISECIEAKLQGKIKVLIVFGCLCQRYKKELKKELPEVDAFFGVHKLQDILMYLNATVYSDLLTQRVLSTPSHYAYLKLAEGCNHRCAFCAIPKIRGKYISKPLEQIVNEAELLEQNGAKELILIAQDLSYYGMDLYKKRHLAALLNELVKISGIEWIRLHSFYPNGFPMEVLEIIRDYDKVCCCLDIPIQHINDEILTSMNRKTSESEIRKQIDTIRNTIPSIALNTKLMVGYPGESKKMYHQLESFVQEIQFERLEVVSYSHEENTSAYALKDSISKTEKEKRKENIRCIQQAISLKKNQQKISGIFNVIIDSENKTHYIGRTEFDSPRVGNVVFISKKTASCTIGDFYPVRITKADYSNLYGEINSNIL